MTAYAIGDIHGAFDRLTALLSRLDDQAHLVFLGDYLDKGPHSKDVVETVRHLTLSGRATALIGNHEFLWLDHIAGGNRAELLMRTGAAATFGSYLGRPIDTNASAALFEDRANLARMFGPHLEFLKALESYAEPTGVPAICVHGGIMPGFDNRDLAEHDLEKLVFLRFGRSAADERWRGRVVIAGHTVVGPAPVAACASIGIDTGAWKADGHLTALDLDSFAYIQDDGTTGQLAVSGLVAA